MLSHVLHTLRSPRFQLTVLLSALSALVVAGPLAHSALTARSAQIGATNGSTTVTESPLPGDLIDAPGSVPEDPPLPEDGIDGSVALPSADDASKIVVDGLTELVAGPVVSEPNQPESTPRTPATGESTPAPTTQPTEDNSGETTPRPTTPAAVTASTGPGPEAPSLEGPDPFVSPTSTTALPRTSSTNVAKPQASTTLISASTTLPSTTAAPTTTTAPNDETGSGDTNGGANGSVGTTVPDAASESDTPTTTAAPSVPPSTVDMCSLDLPDSIETGDDCTILDLLPGLGEVELPPTTVAPPVSTPPTTDASATGAPTTTPVSPTTGSSTPATSTPEASTSPTGVASTDGRGIDVSLVAIALDLAFAMSMTEPAAPPPGQADDKDWTWVLDRPCPECGAAVGELSLADVAAANRENAAGWRDVLGRGDAWVRARPAKDVWSPLEYACHVRDVFRLFAVRLDLMLTEDDPMFANWNPNETAEAERYDLADPAIVSAELSEAAEDLAVAFEQITEEQAQRPGRRSDGAKFTVLSFARYEIHDPIHHLWDVASPS